MFSGWLISIKAEYKGRIRNQNGTLYIESSEVGDCMKLISGIVYSVTYGEYTDAPKRLFSNAFYNEIPYAIKENNAEDAKRNKLKK